MKDPIMSYNGSPEAAKIDQETTVVTSLIDAAMRLSIIDDEEQQTPARLEMQGKAAAFLSAWFERKKPSLEMPAIDWDKRG